MIGMRKGARFLAVVGVIALAMSSQSLGADAGRIIRSVAFPGMGQLGDGMGELGNGYTLKGLCFMTVEVVALSFTVAEAAKSNSYARQTAYLEVDYHLASRYEDRLQKYNAWQAAFDNSGKSKTMTMVYGGAAAGIWLLNIADVLIFAPKEGASQGMLKAILDNTVATVGADKAQISYRVSF
jgi:hypothetical protein